MLWLCSQMWMNAPQSKTPATNPPTASTLSEAISAPVSLVGSRFLVPPGTETTLSVKVQSSDPTLSKTHNPNHLITYSVAPAGTQQNESEGARLCQALILLNGKRSVDPGEVAEVPRGKLLGDPKQYLITNWDKGI